MTSSNRRKLARSAVRLPSSPTCSRWTVGKSCVLTLAAIIVDLSAFTQSFSPVPAATLQSSNGLCITLSASLRSSRVEPVGRSNISRRRVSQYFPSGTSVRWVYRWVTPSLTGSAMPTSAIDAALTPYTTAPDGEGGGTRRRDHVNGANYMSTGEDNGERVAITTRADGRRDVVLHPGVVVECWHAKTLVLGNYEGLVPERRSLRVRTAAGESLAIDAGQIVGVWSADDVRGPVPSCTAEWMELQARARALLQGMPARGLDMSAFWKAANIGRNKVLVTPAHAAEYLFSENQAQVGLKKRRPFHFNHEESFAPTAVQRAAATQVLTGELIRFKRVVSERVEHLSDKLGTTTITATVAGGEARGEDATSSREEARLRDEDLNREGESVLIRVGGFKAMDQSVAETRGVMEFCRLVRKIKQHKVGTEAASNSKAGGGVVGDSLSLEAASARAGLFEPAYLLILHSLEAYALGGDERSVAPEARRALEQLGKVSPAHARRVLVDVGLWTERTPPGEGGGGSGGGSTRDRHAGDTPAPGSGTAGAGEGDGAGTGSSNDLAVLAEAGAGVGVIPWAADVLEAASALGKERSRRASNYEKKPPQVDIGAPAPFGRYDFRRADFGVYCVDGDGTSFYDDAISVDRETGEVFVHITDVQSLVHQGSTLDEVARLRASSEYLPQGPLFMMPPTALKALSLSDRAPNEALTVGFKVDPETGRVTTSRIMLTTLPPAALLTFDEVDSLLSASEGKGGSNDDYPGYFAGAVQGRAALPRERIEVELRALEEVARLTSKGSGRGERAKGRVHIRSGKRGELLIMGDPDSRARRILNELLNVYSQEVYKKCSKAGVAMPSLIGQQNLLARGRSRCGTGPLRRYVDILAQRQIAAILRGTGFLSKKYLISTVSYLTWRHNKTRYRRQEEAGRLSLEALAAHCRTQMKATGLRYAIVPARGTGKGREVRLDGLGVLVHVKRAPGKKGHRRGVAIHEGQEVKVMIERVAPHLKEVVATEFHD